MSFNGWPKGSDGDPRAELFQSFVARYYGLIWSRCMTFFRNTNLAEDACQETFLRAWKYLDAYDPECGGAEAWLVAIARNVCKDVAEANRRVQYRPLDEETTCQLEALDEHDVQELAPWARSLTELPEPHGSLVAAWFDCDGDVDRIAKKLHVTAGAVRAAWCRLRKVFLPLVGWGDWMAVVEPQMEVVLRLKTRWLPNRIVEAPKMISVELDGVSLAMARPPLAWKDLPGVDHQAVRAYLDLEPGPFKDTATLETCRHTYWGCVAFKVYCNVFNLKERYPVPVSSKYDGLEAAVALELYATARMLAHDPSCSGFVFESDTVPKVLESVHKTYTMLGLCRDAARVSAKARQMSATA